jgi:hypothetical protein
MWLNNAESFDADFDADMGASVLQGKSSLADSGILIALVCRMIPSEPSETSWDRAPTSRGETAVT